MLSKLVPKLTHYDNIVLTGPQRSGTRIGAKILSSELGYEYVDEVEVRVDSLYRLRWVIEQPYQKVVQCPGLCRYAVFLESVGNTAIVLMKRNVQDIVASQDRIGWTERFQDLERALYPRPYSALSIALCKYAYWDEIQRRRLEHGYELEYESLAEHALWVPQSLRADWDFTQTEAE